MRRSLIRLAAVSLALCAWPLLAVAVALAGATDKPLFRPNEKAAFADPRTISFVRPGLSVRVNSAEIAADGTISVLFSLSDPRGLPLDREGITTPGTVALSFIAAHIPQGQQQYVAYTTRRVTGRSAVPSLRPPPTQVALTRKSPTGSIDISSASRRQPDTIVPRLIRSASMDRAT